MHSPLLIPPLAISLDTPQYWSFPHSNSTIAKSDTYYMLIRVTSFPARHTSCNSVLNPRSCKNNRWLCLIHKWENWMSPPDNHEHGLHPTNLPWTQLIPLVFILPVHCMACLPPNQQASRTPSPLLPGTSTKSILHYPVWWTCHMGIQNLGYQFKARKNHCIHAPTQIFVPVLPPLTLTFYLQVHMSSSWDILIPLRPQYNFTPRPSALREHYIATSIIMALN